MLTADRPPREHHKRPGQTASTLPGRPEWRVCREHPQAHIAPSVIVTGDSAPFCIGDGLEFEGHVRGHPVGLEQTEALP